MKFMLPPDKMAHLCETLLDDVARLREENERLRDGVAQHHVQTASSTTFTIQPLKCVECGLQKGAVYPFEPTVGLRADGFPRCASCATTAAIK